MRLVTFLLLLLTVIALLGAAPIRIVSIAPSFTEILYALGLGNRVVGTTNYCDYPDAARRTEKVGDMLNPNLEKIISLRPDIVFCGSWKWYLPEKLRDLNIRVVEIKDAQTVEDIYERILLIGKETSTQKEAQRIVERMKKEAQQIASHSAQGPRPKVYLELDSGQWTVGGGSYMNEILQIIGAQNIFADRKESYFMATTESVAARDPDVIISLWRSVQDYQKAENWRALRAVKENRILDLKSMDWNLITRQSPRMIEGMRQLQHLLTTKTTVTTK